jgi:Ca2+-binding RTX toxin-like protein
MAVIRIERVPVGVGGLGLLGFDHLQLVYQPDETSPISSQDTWYVLEGLRVAGIGTGFTLGVEGYDGRTTLPEANGGASGSALVAAIGTPAQRGSRVLGFADAVGAWTLMASYGREIALQELPYFSTSFDFSPLPTINSNSVVASLLYYAGIDIALAWPRGVRFTPGWTTLIGTRANDHMTMDNAFTTLVAGDGNDTLEGSGDSRIDKMYGGLGDDTFKWSTGTNYIHGGQPRLDYGRDGLDTVDYAGVGNVEITGNPDFVPDKTPNYVASFASGTDYLFSIERIVWDAASDIVVIGEGASVFDQGLILDLGQQSSAGHGDSTDFSALGDGLLFNARTGDEMVVTTAGGGDGENGLWLESPEWLVGSSGDDLVFTTASLRGIEAGDGNDLVDARLVAAFGGNSPNGYDIEIDGGGGDDILVADAGRTLLHGGDGADRFIVPALSGSAGKIVVTIDDADAGDRLFVPHALFDGSGDGLDGSPLLPLLGGIGTYGDMLSLGYPSIFDWRTQDQIHLGTDLTTGYFTFLGDVSYWLSGSDLVVHILGGHPEYVPDGTRTLTVVGLDVATETDIVIKDYQPGDLGLTFFDPGTPYAVQTPYGTALYFSEWDAAVAALAGGAMEDPLEARPAAPSQRFDEAAAQLLASAPVEGTGGADTITLTGAAIVAAGDGDDSITGSGGRDIIDGGAGSDTMQGGGGNDTYEVDAAGDIVVESAGNGRDSVLASASYALSANIEDLTLTGAAVAGAGNELGNAISGNDGDNLLSGLDGADTLTGGAGSDILDGGAGGDAYVYVVGDGADTVLDSGPAGDIDRLALTGIDAGQVRVYRRAASPNDLVLAFADGGSVTVKDFMPGAGLEAVTFDIGPAWTRADLEALAAAAPILAADPPTAVADPYLAVAQQSVTISAETLLANDLSPSGLPLHISGVSAAAGGTVTLRADGDLDVVGPAGGGELSFTYTVDDGQGGTASATATVSFVANAAPVAAGTLADASATVGAALSIVVPGSLFGDADGDPLTLTASLSGGAPLPAWLVFDASTGTFSGTPPSGAAGALDIVVTASDGLAATATGFRLTIAGETNTPPVASAEQFTTDAGSPLAIAAASLLANDSDADGDPLTVTGVAAVGGHGTVQLLGDGSVLYTPTAGYTGLDTFSYTVSDGRGGTATVVDTIDVRAVPGIAIIGTTGADTLPGSAGDDTITGGRGDDRLTGGGGNDLFLVTGTNQGNDVFDGGTGTDTIRGSAGNDVIGLAAAAGNLAGIEVIDGGAGSDTLRGTSGADLIDLSATTLLGIELISGLGGDDTIVGSSGGDTIQGGGGNDDISSGGGNDVLLLAAGSNGSDVYDGGSGFDIILGTSGNDILGLASGSAGLAGIELVDGAGGLDTLRGTSGADLIDLSGLTLAGSWTIQGLGGNDTITGTSGNDTIQGGGGNDQLGGGAGDDTFLLAAGGNGFDVYDGGAGSNRILGTAGNDVLGLANGSAGLAGIASIDLGAGSDTLRGTAAADSIDLSAIILAGIELIDGGAGNDTLTGGAGDDVLRGGGGNDTFVVTLGSGNDTIGDFARGTNAAPLADVIDVSAFGFGSFAALSASFAASASGTDTIITLGATTSLTLTGVAPGQLKADDFRV